MIFLFVFLFACRLGGHADNSVKLISSDGAKTIETAVAHFAPVTCLSLSPDSNYLVTGSRDTTVILWRMHRAILTRSSSISEPSTNSAVPSAGSPLASGNSNNFAENSRRRRIEGPVHVLRGHLKEILCCCVNSDVGIVVSSSLSSGVLLHSVRRGRLIRKLTGVEAHAVCLSSKGVILTWNKFEQKLRTFTINGVPVATAVLSPFLGSISCIEVSVDGESVLIGMNSCSVDKSAENGCSRESESDKSETKDLTMVLREENVNRLAVPVPSVCFLDLHTLQVRTRKQFLLRISCTFCFFFMVFSMRDMLSNKLESVYTDTSYPGARRRARYYCLSFEQG